MSGRSSRRVIVGVAAVVVLGGCAIDEVTPAPGCANGGSIVIVAQSVPGAAYVPCIDDRGAGWSAVHVRVDEDGTELRFALGPDRRVRAEVSFTGICAAAEGTPTDGRGDLAIADVPNRVRTGGDIASGRWYRFDGGCVVVEVADGVGHEAAAALVDSVVLLPWAELAVDRRRGLVNEEL